MARRTLLHAGVALVVLIICTISILCGMAWWSTLLLGFMWLVSIILGIREWRKVATKDRLELQTWLHVGGDLILTAPVTVSDEQQTITTVGPGFARTLGWDKHEMEGHLWRPFVHPDDVESSMSQAHILADGRDVFQYTNRWRHKQDHADGSPRWVWLEWNALLDTTLGCVYANARDMTARFERQEQVQQHRGEMDKAMAELRDRNNDLERFASVAAHQLRSPPRTIAGIAQALDEDYGHLLDEEGTLFLQDIRNDADQMAEIVDGLYRFSMVRTSEDMPLLPVDLNEMLQEIYEAQSKRGCFGTGEKVLLWERLPIVMGEKVLLKEVFVNLFDNAFKFNESEVKKVEVTCNRRSDTRWDIDVSDNGIGIDPVYQPKLFTMFQRVHTAYAGTGVGLALVAAIVNKLGGEITVESHPDQGAKFRFDLMGACPECSSGDDPDCPCRKETVLPKRASKSRLRLTPPTLR